MKNLIIVAIALVVFSCSKSGDPAPNPVAPTPTAAELVKKVWSAGVLQWDGTTQFDKSSSANLVAGNRQYRLDLTCNTAVTLTEFDGKKFTVFATPSATSLSLETTATYMKASSKKLILT